MIRTSGASTHLIRNCMTVLFLPGTRTHMRSLSVPTACDARVTDWRTYSGPAGGGSAT
jgi:hypothetical protein